MSYTIKRNDKTYEEFRQYILETVEAKELDAGDESAMLARRYESNDKWFKKNQEQHDLKERIKDLKDLRIAIQLAGVSQLNPALVAKRILEEGDMEMLLSLESVKDQVNSKLQEHADKKAAHQEAKDKKAELKELFKDLKHGDIKAADRNKFIDYMMKHWLNDE